MSNQHMSLEYAIERLVAYGLNHMLVEGEDVNWLRNKLIEVLEVEDYRPENLETDLPSLMKTIKGLSIDDILSPLLDYGAQNGLLKVDSLGGRDLFDAKLMGCLMPRPSQVIDAFEKAYGSSPEAATSYYYGLSLVSNYIRKSRTDQNIVWKAESAFGDIDITINLSKPEKDPKEIEAEKLAVKAAYPKCLLCAENEGYMGRVNHPGRQNHRIIPVTLADEPWYFQYSPYAYYNEHAIVLSEAHRPMKIERKTFERLLDFVAYMPHYFVGSNADLPIVGGSILSHDHFQGGRYEFPMDRAEALARFQKGEVEASFLNWPLSVIRLKGSDSSILVDLADEILKHWQGYSDEAYGIRAFSDTTPHNTITPIARYRHNRFELDLVLRNNRTDAAHPAGIFHPHERIHPIKKENIGLIEVMGLAVLPARLAVEMDLMVASLLNKPLEAAAQLELEKHLPMVSAIRDSEAFKQCKDSEADVKALVMTWVGRYFTEGLSHCGVYKPDANGIVGMERFLLELSWKKVD